MKFTEEKLEKALTELLANEGFPFHFGKTTTSIPSSVLNIRYFVFIERTTNHSCILFVYKLKKNNKTLIFNDFLFNSNSESGFNLLLKAY
jgi:hypothetical protein